VIVVYSNLTWLMQGTTGLYLVDSCKHSSSELAYELSTYILNQ